MHEQIEPTTFEAAVDNLCLRFGIPGNVKTDYISLIIDQIDWEAACIYHPTTRLSGNEAEGYSKRRKNVDQAMKTTEAGRKALEQYGHAPIWQITGHDEQSGAKVINPNLLLPATSPTLEKKRAAAVKSLQDALGWDSDPQVQEQRATTADRLLNILGGTSE